MQTPAPLLEFNDSDSPSIWPWVIGAIALILLSVSLRADLQHIPRSLSRLAHVNAQSAGASNIDIKVDGRDITLSGNLTANVDRDALVEQIGNIDGVRIIIDDMVGFDPKEKERRALLGFNEGLDTIDYSEVTFERGSASLTAQSRTALMQLIQVLRTYPQYRIRVSGHTDNTGRAEVNLRISRQRASAVVDYLIDNGISQNQVIAQGYGATRPIADNSTEAGRTANRRIEVSYVN